MSADSLNQTYRKIVSNMQEIKARNGKILAIVNARDQQAAKIAVKENARGRGVASFLIEQSLKNIIAYLKKRGSKLKIVEVTTGADNQAQRGSTKKHWTPNPKPSLKTFSAEMKS